MGSKGYIVESSEWVVQRQWLDVKYIESRTSDASPSQNIDQGLLVHDRTSRSVDEESGGLHEL